MPCRPGDWVAVDCRYSPVPRHNDVEAPARTRAAVRESSRIRIAECETVAGRNVPIPGGSVFEKHPSVFRRSVRFVPDCQRVPVLYRLSTIRQCGWVRAVLSEDSFQALLTVQPDGVEGSVRCRLGFAGRPCMVDDTDCELTPGRPLVEIDLHGTSDVRCRGRYRSASSSTNSRVDTRR